MPPYPIMLDLSGRDVLLVGGGEVAARKAAALLAAGARLRVVAPALGAELRVRLEAGEITWQARAATPDDVGEAVVVVCAAADARANAAVAARARGLRIPVVVADAPEEGTASLPATVRRGRLLISLSTGGTSPAFAAFLRRRLESELDPELAELADLAARMRERGRAAGLGAAERERAASAAFPHLLELLRAGRREEAARFAEEAATSRAGAAPWS